MDDRTYPDELARLRAENERLTHDLADAQTIANLQRDLHAAELGQCVSENNQLAENAAELGKALDVCIAERDSAFAELDKHRRELTALRDERPRLLAANVRLFHDNNKLRRMSSLWKRTAKHYKRLRINDDRFRLLAESTFAKENEQLRAELDAERNAHNATAAQLYAKLDAQAKRHADVIERWKVEENTWHEFDKEQLTQIAALRAELDAMREAHSVIAGRMAAMGC